MTSEIKKYGFIDALRGYAIALVVLVHSAQAVKPESWTLRTFMDFGARGVQLFFIASAITLCLSWYGRKQFEQGPVRNFFIRRLFRIAPMYWLATAFYLALYGFEPRYWAPNGLSWYSIPLTLLFLNGYSPENINSLVPGGWSIAVEMNFYLIFPLVLAIVSNLPRSIIFALLAIGFGLVAGKGFEVLFLARFSAEQAYIVREYLFLNFFNQLPVFAFGIITYYVLSNKRLSRPVAVLSVAVLVGVFLLVCLFRGGAIAYMGGNLLVASGLFSILAIALHAFPTKFLVNKPVEYIGKISFSLYLVHFAVLFYLEEFGVKAKFAQGDASSIGYFLLVMAASSAVAAVLQVYVEKPGVRLGARLIRKIEGSTDASALERVGH